MVFILLINMSLILIFFYRCSQHNHNSLLDEDKSTNTENCCQHCLTPWKHGNFVLKTLPNRENKNDKTQKKHSTMLFNMVNFDKYDLLQQ